jgi:MFS family permease
LNWLKKEGIMPVNTSIWSPYRWVIMVINFLFLAVAYAGLSTWAVAIPFLQKTFNLSAAQIQLGASMLMAGYAVGSFVEAQIAAKIGFKKTGLIAAILLLVPQFLIPYATFSYGFILFLRFVQGWGVVWFVTTSMATAWFPLEERGIAAGVVSGAIPFGVGIGGILVGAMLSWVGSWQTSFIYFGILVLIIAGLWTILAKDPPVIEKAAETVTAETPKVNPYKLAAGWLVAFALFFNAFQLIGLYTVLSPYLYKLGYESTKVGSALLAAGLIGAISTPLGGIISDAWVRKGQDPVKARAYVMAIPGFLVATIGSILIPFIAPIGYIPMIIIAIVAGWGVPLTNSSIGALPTDMLGSPAIAGKLFGLIILVGIAGAVIAPYVLTAIAGSAGWTVAFIICGLGAFVGFVIGMVIPRFRLAR